MQARKIIVINPGSLNLRIGRAGDLNPVTVLHAIGRLRKKTDLNNPYQYHYQRDGLLPSLKIRTEKFSSDDNDSIDFHQDFETERAEITSFIQEQIIQGQRDSDGTTLSSNKSRSGSVTTRAVVLPQLNREELINYNRSQKPTAIDSSKHRYLKVSYVKEDLSTSSSTNDEQCTFSNALSIKKENDADTTLPDRIFDKDILNLTTSQISKYNIHFPYQRGDLNVHDGVGGSLVSVLADLEAIWSYVLKKHLQICPKALSHFGAVLVIPEVYNRSYLKDILTMLLVRLGFRACFLVQDHVAATFGACLGYACVVDIGDQKCSISCVEDGISQLDTRVCLGYGSGDLTQILHFLLKKCSFPYENCNPSENFKDAILLNQLKEEYCHLNFTLEAVKADRKQHTFEIKDKGICYDFKIDDEALITPLAFFYTKLLYLTEKERLVQIQLRISEFSDPEDCFDGEYLRETSRVRNGRIDQLLDGGNGPVTGDAVDEDMVGVVDTYEMEDRNTYERARNFEKDEQQNLYLMNPGGLVVPLDIAIVQSIDRCPSDDMKRKMYSSILLVGGGSKISGIRRFLEQRILYQLGQQQRTPLEVNVCSKEMDASVICWKGAAIMSCLESASELWIMSTEWEKYGLRILREKAIFNW